MKYYYGKHSVDNKDVFNVLSSIKSGVLSQGKKLLELESKVANFCKAKYCLAVSSGTAALHLATLACGLKKKEYSFTSTLTWSATANVNLYAGADVKFIDIEPDTFNININDLEKKLFFLKKNKKKMPKLVIPVHFAGMPANLDKLKILSNKYKFKVIEDAAQAMGAIYKNKKIGSCAYSNITIFSLHPVKSITAGEGGLILTNEKKLYDKMKLLRSHGMKKNKNIKWTSEVVDLGFNYRITEMQCALALSQLKKLNIFMKKRRKIVELYKDSFNSVNLDIKFQKNSDNSNSSNHLCVILLPESTTLSKKMKFNDLMKKDNIQLGMQYLPVHLHSYYIKRYGKIRLKFSENYFKRAFSLPVYPDLSFNDIKYITKKFIKNFKKVF